jgi:hypothetical protein
MAEGDSRSIHIDLKEVESMGGETAAYGAIQREGVLWIREKI